MGLEFNSGQNGRLASIPDTNKCRGEIIGRLERNRIRRLKTMTTHLQSYIRILPRGMDGAGKWVRRSGNRFCVHLCRSLELKGKNAFGGWTNSAESAGVLAGEFNKRNSDDNPKEYNKRTKE